MTENHNFLQPNPYFHIINTPNEISIWLEIITACKRKKNITYQIRSKPLIFLLGVSNNNLYCFMPRNRWDHKKQIHQWKSHNTSYSNYIDFQLKGNNQHSLIGLIKNSVQFLYLWSSNASFCYNRRFLFIYLFSFFWRWNFNF